MRHQLTGQRNENRAVGSSYYAKVCSWERCAHVCHLFISLFLFSFKWGHSKTWVASYPSELFISGILPKSLEVCCKNRTPHKSLKKASCFNILGGGAWIRLFVKRALVLDWRTMKCERQSSAAFYCDCALTYFDRFGRYIQGYINSELCSETKHKQAAVACYFRVWRSVFNVIWLLFWG